MIRRDPHAARVLALTVALAGCGGATSSAAGPTPQPPSATAAEPSSRVEEAPPQPAAEPATKRKKPAPDSVTGRLMSEHFEVADIIRLALIAGRREDIAEPARRLAYLSAVDEFPPGWRGDMTRMQDAAERLAGSDDMATAAAATADIGTYCGHCHQRLGGPSPSVEAQAPPSSDGSLRDRMTRHAWATERLWEGLYVPSSEAWDSGIAALISDPFPVELLKRRGASARSAAQDFAQVVAKAPGDMKAQDKAVTYSELLATCGTCHLATE